MREVAGYLALTLLAVVLALVTFNEIAKAITGSVNQTADQIRKVGERR